VVWAAGVGSEVGVGAGFGVLITGGVTTGAGGGGVTGATAPLLASSTNWRDPPRALATACSNSVALLCTMPIQLPATCTTARLASSRTNWPCWESSIRVEGNSRLPRICCHSSAKLVLPPLLVKSGNAGELVTEVGGTKGC